jgi:hypothetical protein
MNLMWGWKSCDLYRPAPCDSFGYGIRQETLEATQKSPSPHNFSWGRKAPKILKHMVHVKIPTIFPRGGKKKKKKKNSFKFNDKTKLTWTTTLLIVFSIIGQMSVNQLQSLISRD